MKYKLTEGEYQTLADEHDGVRADYSGRGMWGEECIAYVGPEPILFAFDLARTIAGRSGDADDAEWVRDNLADLASPSLDGMGHETVWYWPQVTVEVDMALIAGDDGS